MTTATDNRALHATALAAGILALVVLFTLPGGPVSYLIAIAAGFIAVLIGHRAVRRSGPLLWAAVGGLVLAYLDLVVSCGLMLVRVTRLLAG
ncbi:hypothetical protein [Leucobacter sp. wl10]|uniref:hypothetical protein n=1 Tax=Leucobacter sp. wl10 TaxID=2304677 RepID=UPI000E5B8C04|nr:hypothetical protein [Leucobacter sp. wl10]RGE20356.1 hypothetical protein D1J51_09225 [Leucobacter sp. wl10]